MKGIVYVEIICFNYYFNVDLPPNYTIANRPFQSEAKANNIWETICNEDA